MSYMVPILMAYEDYEFLKLLLDNSNHMTDDFIETVVQVQNVTNDGEMGDKEDINERVAVAKEMYRQMGAIKEKYFKE